MGVENIRTARMRVVGLLIVTFAVATWFTTQPAAARAIGNRAAATSSPVAIRVIPCRLDPTFSPQQYPGLRPPAPSPVAVRLPKFIVVPPGAHIYHAEFPGPSTGQQGRSWNAIGPAESICKASFGTGDGSMYLELKSQSDLSTAIDAGGFGENVDLACPYIPEGLTFSTREHMQRFCVRPKAELVSAIPTETTGLYLAAVRVPPGVKDFNIVHSGGVSPTLALVAAHIFSFRGQAHLNTQVSECTLPDRRRYGSMLGICRASLALFLASSQVGRRLSASNLARAEASLAAFLASSTAAQPEDPCDLASLEMSLDPNVTAFSAFVGGKGTLEVAATSQHLFDLRVKGRFRVGLSGGWGERFSAGKSGQQIGEGLSGTVSAGLEVGAGATLQMKKPQDLEQLVQGLQSGNSNSPLASAVSVSEMYVEMGAWLTGDGGAINVKTGGSASFDVSGVIGAKISLNHNRLEKTTYYVAVRASSSFMGGVKLPLDVTLPDVLPIAGGSGSFEGELVAWYAVDGANRPISSGIDLKASLTRGIELKGQAKDLPSFYRLLKKVEGGISTETGHEVDVSARLDLVDQNNLSAWNQVMNGDNSDAAISQLFDRITKAGQAEVVTYRVSKESSGIDLTAGAGVRFGLHVSGDKKVKMIREAAFIAPGGHMRPWTACHTP